MNIRITMAVFIFIGAFMMRSQQTLASNSSAPALRFEWIDEDGTVVPVEWHSETAWVWNENHLTLQSWFEIPNHLVEKIPPSLAKRIVPASTKPSFKLTPDHKLFSVQLGKSVELLKFNELRNQFLRISVDSTKTTWLRHANCKDANPYVEEAERSEQGPLFISVYCRGRDNDDTVWIEVAASDEASVSVLPYGNVKQKGNAVLMPMPGLESLHEARSPERRLAVLEIKDSAGEPLSKFDLNAAPELPVAPPIARIEAQDPKPATEKADRITAAKMGLHAQFFSTTKYEGPVTTEGTSAAEFAISLNAKYKKLSAELELPIRRLGTGLDSGQPADHVSWLYLGQEIDRGFISKNTTVNFGAQAAIVDSRTDSEAGRTRISSTLLSPAVQFVYRDRHSVTIAPFDFQSQIASARARLQFPLPNNERYAIAVEGFWGRTLGSGNKGWDVGGGSVGLTGAF
ncbi:MAG: hypothetical protein EOP05_08685 [Proteobacteria bacterium]|nr:MAG: hypothetical protein EOP05_08685 [Pseudomonadota bacterium]